MPQQEMRFLLAWCDRDEAVNYQLDSRLPKQGEDTTVKIQRWTSARNRVQGRAAYNLPTPTLEPLSEELRTRGEACVKDPMYWERSQVMTCLSGWQV